MPLPTLDAERFYESLVEAVQNPRPAASRPELSSSEWDEDQLDDSHWSDTTPNSDVSSRIADIGGWFVLAVVFIAAMVPLATVLSSGDPATIGDRPLQAIDELLRMLRAGFQAVRF